MALQMIYVDDTSPGACGDAGLVYNGSTTLTSSKIIAGTAMTMSGTADITGNTTVGGTLGVTGASTLASVTVTGATALNGGITCDTNRFTVANTSGNTAIAGTLAVTGATTLTGNLAANGNITLATTKNLVGGVDSDILMNTNKFVVAGATGNTTVAGTLAVAGATTHTNKVAFGATENAAASGAWAIPITTLYDGATTNATAALAATLADGVVGQMKIIMLTTKNTNNMIVTPANLNGGTTITFDATGEFALLVFVGTGWTVIHTTATVA